jgi:predicted DNA-binding transcriptional regulator AlpA
MAEPDATAVYLTAAQVRSRYGGVSDMSLWRWLHDEQLGFPKPVWIQNRRFWKASDLAAWDETRPSQRVRQPEPQAA